MAAVIVVAAGSGTRFGAEGKMYLPIAGVPLVLHTLKALASTDSIERIVLVARTQDRAVVMSAAVEVGAIVVHGGITRHQSERAGLEALRPMIASGAVDVVAIHDGARPCVTTRLIEKVVSVANEVGGAVPCLPVQGPVVRQVADAVSLVATDELGAAQTPQAFKAMALLAAYDAAYQDGFEGTDTVATMLRYGGLRIAAVDGEADNLKVTFPEDLARAEEILQSRLR
jgi:2-C-methyl-D-erythritol 4-phosphate cytidylyltransferase